MVPRVGISSCLLGERVRYDGGHRKQSALLAAFDGQIEWVATCPEVELGLGVPRQTIQIERRGEQLHLVTCESRQDLTPAMTDWAKQRISFLQAQQVCGYVFKARSPSCGVGSVTVADTAEKTSGMFAAALGQRLPELPLAEEEALDTDERRALFLQRVHSYYQARLTKVIG
jgi:uncharacterized protein YbbK (DUF523 family)